MGYYKDLPLDLQEWESEKINTKASGRFIGFYECEYRSEGLTDYTTMISIVFIVMGKNGTAKEIITDFSSDSDYQESLQFSSFAHAIGFEYEILSDKNRWGDNTHELYELMESCKGCDFTFRLKYNSFTSEYHIDFNTLEKVDPENHPLIPSLVYSKGRESEFIEWNGHYFRSPQELAIAKELDNRKVLFFPNAGCRVNERSKQRTREVDFLICIDGNWGILECDSDTYHTSAAKDHKRDELFNRHGIWFIKRFTSEDCQNPVNVVDNFLQLMEQFYNRK